MTKCNGHVDADEKKLKLCNAFDGRTKLGYDNNYIYFAVVDIGILDQTSSPVVTFHYL